jgi:hypothetical protein
MKFCKDESATPHLVPRKRGCLSHDLVDSIWYSEIVPMLRATPRLRPIAVLRQIYKNHPGIGQGVRRTVERRIRRWQNVNDPDPSDFLPSAHQGILEISDLPARAQAHESIHDILMSYRSGTLAHRNRLFWRWLWCVIFHLAI